MEKVLVLVTSMVNLLIATINLTALVIKPKRKPKARRNKKKNSYKNRRRNRRKK